MAKRLKYRRNSKAARSKKRQRTLGLHNPKRGTGMRKAD